MSLLNDYKSCHLSVYPLQWGDEDNLGPELPLDLRLLLYNLVYTCCSIPSLVNPEFQLCCHVHFYSFISISCMFQDFKWRLRPQMIWKKSVSILNSRVALEISKWDDVARWSMHDVLQYLSEAKHSGAEHVKLTYCCSTDYMDMINMDVGITNSKSPVQFHPCQLSIMSANSFQRAITTHLEASENLPASALVFR